jgi:hypothetical protein
MSEEIPQEITHGELDRKMSEVIAEARGVRPEDVTVENIRVWPGQRPSASLEMVNFPPEETGCKVLSDGEAAGMRQSAIEFLGRLGLPKR